MRDRIFKSQYREPKRFHAHHGSRIHKLYGAVYDENGRLGLEEKGEESIYDHIQSFADSVDIHVIMKRFANGEMDVLSKVQGFYGDFTDLPVDYAQLLNTVNAGERLFDSLPVEQRAKFGHSFNEFMTAMCDGSLMDRLGVTSSPADPGNSPAYPGNSPAVPDPSPADE